MTNITASEQVETMRRFLPPLVETSLEPRADHMAQLIAFHELYGVPRKGLGSQDPEFRHMDDARVGLRLGLIVEEFKELLLDGFGIKTSMAFYRDSDNPDSGDWRTNDIALAMRTISPLRNGVEIADALGDLVYVIYGFALEMGYDLRAVIKEIHASNMTKLGEDGKPIYREDGKVLKGPNYVKPNIPAVLFDAD